MHSQKPNSCVIYSNGISFENKPIQNVLPTREYIIYTVVERFYTQDNANYCWPYTFVIKRVYVNIISAYTMYIHTYTTAMIPA